MKKEAFIYLLSLFLFSTEIFSSDFILAHDTSSSHKNRIEVFFSLNLPVVMPFVNGVEKSLFDQTLTPNGAFFEWGKRCKYGCGERYRFGFDIGVSSIAPSNLNWVVKYSLFNIGQTWGDNFRNGQSIFLSYDTQALSIATGKSLGSSKFIYHGGATLLMASVLTEFADYSTNSPDHNTYFINRYFVTAGLYSSIRYKTKIASLYIQTVLTPNITIGPYASRGMTVEEIKTNPSTFDIGIRINPVEIWNLNSD